MKISGQLYGNSCLPPRRCIIAHNIRFIRQIRVQKVKGSLRSKSKKNLFKISQKYYSQTLTLTLTLTKNVPKPPTSNVKRKTYQHINVKRPTFSIVP